MLQPRTVTAYLPNVNEVISDHLASLPEKLDPETNSLPDINNEYTKLTMEGMFLLSSLLQSPLVNYLIHLLTL